MSMRTVLTATWGLCAALVLAQPVAAQQNGGQQPGNGQGDQQQAGIRIDARGVVTPIMTTEKSEALSRKRREARAKDRLPADLNRFSPRRKISLPRLEAACAEYADKGEPLPDEMLYLAGLQRIEHVFVYPDRNDLVIAGPAEGFGPGADGRTVGLTTGRPPVRLDDLAVALRAAQNSGHIGCSIDPVPEQLSDFQQFVRRNSSPATPAVVKKRYQKMADILGLQKVSIDGVPPHSHFARALVEADYRMKLVSIGLQEVDVPGFRSHLAMLQPGGNSIQRWWFVPLYDAFYTNGDRNAFHFEGQRAQLLAQEEISDVYGRRRDASFTRLSTRKFARLFTEKFPELVKEVPVFAELQNLIDLAVLTALFEKERLPQRAGWDMALFLDPARLSFPEGNVPRRVPTAFSYKRANRGMILGLLGGGVKIHPMRTVQSLSFQVDPGQRLEGLHRGAGEKKAGPEEHPWWWD